MFVRIGGRSRKMPVPRLGCHCCIPCIHDLASSHNQVRLYGTGTCMCPGSYIRRGREAACGPRLSIISVGRALGIKIIGAGQLFEYRVSQGTRKKNFKLGADKEKPSNDAPKMTAHMPTPDHRPRMQKPREALALDHVGHAPGQRERRRTFCVPTHGR